MITRILSMVACILLMLPIQAKAQDNIKFGIEAGTNLSLTSKSSKHVGWNVGGTVKFSMSDNWLVETGLSLTSNPIGSTFWNYEEHADRMPDYTYYYLDKGTPWYINIPVRIGYDISLGEKWNMCVSCGPYFGLGLWGESKWTKVSHNNADNTFDMENYEKVKLFDNDILRRFELGVSGKAEIIFLDHYGMSLEYKRQINSMDKISKLHYQSLQISLHYHF